MRAWWARKHSPCLLIWSSLLEPILFFGHGVMQLQFEPVDSTQIGHNDPHSTIVLYGQFIGKERGGLDLGYYGRYYQWSYVYSFKQTNVPRPEASEWYDPTLKI